MDAPKPKLYHKHGMDTRGHLETYFSCGKDNVFREETLHFIMNEMHNVLAGGKFKGKTAYDFRTGSIIHQLHSVCDCYKEITILKLSDSCIMELNKWLATRTGAFDWSHTHDYMNDLHCTSDQEEINREENLKTCIKRVLKFDLQKPNLTDPEVLEQADCIVSLALLDIISENENEYIENFKRITDYLRPGGLLILFGCFNTSFFKIGEERYHFLTYDENFVRQNLANQGFKINTWQILDRKVQSDLSDYKQLMFVTAIKECKESRLP